MEEESKERESEMVFGVGRKMEGVHEQRLKF